MHIEFQLLSAKKITVFLIIMIMFLFFCSTIGQVSKYYYGHGHLLGLVPLFYLDYEANIPTWFSSFILFIASTLLFFITKSKYKQRDEYRLFWASLAVIFLYLSIDETAMLHEYPIDPLRKILNAGGFLYYTWVVPAIIILIALGIFFWKFLIHLPVRTRISFIIAGSVYVGGAVGVEMISGYYADLHGERNMIYASIITVEEIFEMSGVTIFIHALREYLPNAATSIKININ